jgi:hypothetical protein
MARFIEIQSDESWTNLGRHSYSSLQRIVINEYLYKLVGTTSSGEYLVKKVGPL